MPRKNKTDAIIEALERINTQLDSLTKLLSFHFSQDHDIPLEDALEKLDQKRERIRRSY